MTTARVIFGWQNQVVTASLSAGSQQAALQVSNLANDQGTAAAGWQTLSGVTTSWFLVDSGNPAQTWQAFLLARTNLTKTATVRWRVGPSGLGSTTYDSGAVSAGIHTGYGQSLTVAGSATAGQVCRCDIVDTSNPDTFLNIALAYAGPMWQPSVNPSWTSATGRDGQVDMVLSKGGQQFPTQRWQRRRWSLKFEGIKANETWTKIMELDRLSRAGGNILFVPDSTTNANYETIFGICTPKADLGFAATDFDARSWAADFTERL